MKKFLSFIKNKITQFLAVTIIVATVLPMGTYTYAAPASSASITDWKFDTGGQISTSSEATPDTKPEGKYSEYSCKLNEKLVFTPGILADGNSANYKYIWYMSSDMKNWEKIKEGNSTDDPEMSYTFIAENKHNGKFFRVDLINEAGIQKGIPVWLHVERRSYELLPGMPTFVAGDHVRITPDIYSPGNTENYTAKWYESKDGGNSWDLVKEVSVDEDPELAYEFYADTEDTFTQYKVEIWNEAGKETSKTYEIGVIEDWLVKDNTLYIYSTGYRDDVESQKKSFNMNNYSGRLEGRQPWSYKLDEIEKVVISDKISSVGEEAFKDLETLRYVDLGDDMAYIKKNAFAGAKNLLGIIIPESGERIEEGAFNGCESMRDLTVYSKKLSIADDPTVLPEGEDNSRQDILALPENEDMVKNQHGTVTIYGHDNSDVKKWAERYSRDFIRINDDNGDTVKWNFTKDEEKAEASYIHVVGDPMGEIFIPKSIGGFEITKLMASETVIPPEEDEEEISTDSEATPDDEEEETEDESDPVVEYTSIFNRKDTETNDKITAVHIPDTITEIGPSALGYLENLKAIYSYSKDLQTCDHFLLGASEEEGAKVWIYSPNYTFEEKIPPNFERRFFDKGTLSGITGDLIWTLDPTDRTLTIGGSGRSADYEDDEEKPWDWAAKYIDTIIINEGVKGLGKNLYSGLDDIRSIINYSTVLTSVDQTSFKDVGINIKNSKTCTTTVSNRLVEAVNEINDDDPDNISEFKFVFTDTTAPIGQGVQFTWSAADKTLTISGDGSMNNYAAEEVEGNNVSETAPWRCVSENLIRKIVIEKGIKNVSNNAFLKMKGLKEVYNYAKGQTVTNGNDNLFDIIERSTEFTDFNDPVTFKIPAPESGTIDPALMDIYRDIAVTNINKAGIKISAEDIADIDVVPGTYTVESDIELEELKQIISGKKTNPMDEKYIVPVYSFGEMNPDFVAAVPQPEEKGYRLVNIYKAQGVCGDNLTWYISMEDVLVIEGFGDMYDFERGKAPWKDYAESIVSISYAEKMTSVGNYAFENMGRIESFSDIPAEVSRIGIGAFKDCVGLENFSIRRNVDVESGAFAGCTNLRTLGIDDPTKYKLSDGILYNADETEILGYLRDSLYKDVDSKKGYEALGEFTLPESLTRVGELAFYGADTINYLEIKGNVTDIGSYAFEGMTNLMKIRNEAKVQQDVGIDILKDAGTTFTDKTAVAYKVNDGFTKAAEDAGYNILYLDDLEVVKISAVYQGKPVTINTAFDPADVIISIIYGNGQSTNVVGTDTRITFSGRDVKNIGDNFFTATYNDGYGTITETNEFSVPGVNGVVAVEFVYRGSSVWFGDRYNKEDVQAMLTFADGSRTTIKGNDTRLTFDKDTVDKIGENVIKVTFDDNINAVFTGEITVKGKNFLREIGAEYKGDTIQLSSGVNGLDLSEVIVNLVWADGSSERTDGEDSRIEITTENAMTDEFLIFHAECIENNRDGLTASFAVPYVSDIREVDFEYVGQPVTQNASISLGDIELTLTFSDGSTQKVRGDSVSGLTGDPMISLHSDASTTVNLTYQTEGKTFTGSVDVPGKLRMPIKLTVVKRPDKTVYEDGEIFDPAGWIINCLYDNGEVLDVSERTVVEGSGVMTADSKMVTLVYEDQWSHSVVKTNLALNVNQNQKELFMSKSFKEQYEITKILFRSKATEDDTYGNEIENEEETEEEDLGKWVDVTPGANGAISDEAAAELATIKAGYGFEVKVWTKYKTNRGGEEFENFLKRAQWDEKYAEKYPDIADINTGWRYLNDIYPQYTYTANPDILYLRVINENLENGGKTNIVTGENGAQDFIVLERTDMPENGDEKIDAGNWYNSTKIFEFPLRDVTGDGTMERRLYVSKDAANPNTPFTNYTIQIVSPAWYGYEPEPEYDYASETFKYIEDQVDDEGHPKNKYYTYSQYLHVCAQFDIRVTKNDDLHTHILQ